MELESSSKNDMASAPNWKTTYVLVPRIGCVSQRELGMIASKSPLESYHDAASTMYTSSERRVVSFAHGINEYSTGVYAIQAGIKLSIPDPEGYRKCDD